MGRSHEHGWGLSCMDGASAACGGAWQRPELQLGSPRAAVLRVFLGADPALFQGGHGS